MICDAKNYYVSIVFQMYYYAFSKWKMKDENAFVIETIYLKFISQMFRVKKYKKKVRDDRIWLVLCVSETSCKYQM